MGGGTQTLALPPGPASPGTWQLLRCQADVSETLRTRPSVIDAVRTATSEIELGGYPIAPGTVVSAMLTAMHRRPDLWPDPLSFRPERFLGDKPQPYSLTPSRGGRVVLRRR